jgi:hypothetical protein
MPKILELDSQKARAYLLEEKNYVNFDLPPYFTFNEILQQTAQLMGDQGVQNFFARQTEGGSIGKPLLPRDLEGVDYKLLSNKDGEFSWRPFEIIHPALYVALVHDITTPQNWDTLTRRFNYFSTSNVTCVSIPYVSDDGETHKAHQVKEWWTNVEQASLRLSLQYQYVFDVDVTDCYGSLYTHSIAWALHSKEVAKTKRKNDLLGNLIDIHIRNMRYGQTNGIPQGSTLMDLIAEIVLGAIDMELSHKLDALFYGPKEYHIIRFRDDYKILTNNPQLGRTIVKELSSTLSNWGLKLNTSKTKMSIDPVLASVKPDKLYELQMPNNKTSLSKKLLQIYSAGSQYPNSGLVVRQLSNFFNIIENSKQLEEYDDPLVMLGIVTNLAIRNPRAYPWCMAIMSHILSFSPENARAAIVRDIHAKFTDIPNTGLLDIWLQRITYTIDPKLPFKEHLARIANGELTKNTLWDSSWLQPDLKEIITNTSLLNQERIAGIQMIIPRAEVALFRPPIFS